MAVRPRKHAPARGVEVRIYSSKNGEDFYPEDRSSNKPQRYSLKEIRYTYYRRRKTARLLPAKRQFPRLCQRSSFHGSCSKILINGCGIAKHFEAYIVDYRNCNLETVYRTEWKAASPYERKDWPTHGYSSIVFDYDNNRVLVYIESIDPKYTKEVGWATQVDRWILYEAKLPES